MNGKRLPFLARQEVQHTGQLPFKLPDDEDRSVGSQTGIKNAGGRQGRLVQPVGDDAEQGAGKRSPGLVNIHQVKCRVEKALPFLLRPHPKRLDFLKVGFKLVLGRSGQGKLLRRWQRLAGTPLPGGGLGLLEQFRLHRVERFDVFHLPREGFFAGETHHDKRESIAGEGIGGGLADGAIRAGDIGERGRKISLTKIRLKFGNDTPDDVENILVGLAELFSNIKGRNAGLAVNECDGGNKTGHGELHWFDDERLMKGAKNSGCSSQPVDCCPPLAHAWTYRAHPENNSRITPISHLPKGKGQKESQCFRVGVAATGGVMSTVGVRHHKSNVMSRGKVDIFSMYAK